MSLDFLCVPVRFDLDTHGDVNEDTVSAPLPVLLKSGVYSDNANEVFNKPGEVVLYKSKWCKALLLKGMDHGYVAPYYFVLRFVCLLQVRP